MEYSFSQQAQALNEKINNIISEYVHKNGKYSDEFNNNPIEIEVLNDDFATVYVRSKIFNGELNDLNLTVRASIADSIMRIKEDAYPVLDKKATNDIREIVIKRRKEVGFTQVDLAEKVGVRRATILNFEKGNTSIRYDTLEKIFEVLEIKLNII